MAGREGFEPTGGHTGLDSAERCNFGSHAMTWLCINEPSCQPRAGRNRAAHYEMEKYSSATERYPNAGISQI